MASQTMMKEKEVESKPLNFLSPAAALGAAAVADEESNARHINNKSSGQYLHKRRCLFWSCGCCGATVVILGVVILILAFTVFKVKDPVLTLNNLYLDGLNSGLGGSLTNPLSVNATLTADVSIENPNVASFKYENSTTEFYYEGQTVGLAYAPDGKVGAHKTVTMNVTVDVLVDRAGKTGVVGTILGGSLINVTTFTDLNGRVNVWGVYKRNIEVMLNCTLSLEVGGQAQEIKNKVCVATVH